uniref:Nck-associated protein 5 C-terminal domain-containing protein n=1 Tax=Eptatretus burgeri TaxID=7764 RepID=A0A8C4NG66_EPTBU
SQNTADRAISSASLQAENSALALENESQREQYERCLDKVANEVVQALLTQKDLREECVRLRTRVGDLEQQNHTLSILFQQKLCLPTSTGLQLQAALAAPAYEGGSLCRLNPASPGSSCSSSDLSLSSSCSEISISSCPRAVHRESAQVSSEVRAHVRRYAGGSGPRDSHEDALQRQRRKENSILRGLRQLVSRDGFMCEERIGLLPSEWPGRECMSSNEGIYSPGYRPTMTTQNSQHIHVKKHSYESDSQDDSGEDLPITQVAVSCHDWTLPSCLRLSHDLPDGFFGLGSHGDLLGSARCLSRLQASMPRCQRQRRSLNSGESRASSANHAVKNGIERHGSDKRRPHKGVGSVTQDSRCLGMKDDQCDPNVRSRAVSVTHMLHRTDAGCVTALCSQVVSLTSPSVTLADNPSMLQFVRSLAGSPGKEDCQQGLSSTCESTGSSTLAVSQEERVPVDYMVLDPEGSRVFEINNGTAISPTDEEPSHDDSASPHNKVAVSSIVALTTNVSDSMAPTITHQKSSEMASTPPALPESESQQKLIKPICSPKHKSGVVYSVSFAPPGFSRARPSSNCSPKKSSLPQAPRDSERQCNTNENEPASNGNEQDKASSPFNSGKTSALSSPAKLSRYLKVSTTGNATKNVDNSCLKTKGERGLTQRVSHLPRNSRSPSKSGESPTKHINCSNGSPPPSAAQDVSTSAQGIITLNTRMPIVSSRQVLTSNATLSQPTPEIPTTSLVHSGNSSGTVSPEQPEEPVRDSPAMPCRLQTPSPPGRSASLLIRPNYDIPPSMTLLKPNYGSAQTQAHHGKVRLVKEKSTSTKMASKLPTSYPSHAARSTMVTPNRSGVQRSLLLGAMTETSQQVTFICSQPKLPLRSTASAPTSPMHVMESEKSQVVKITTAAEKESNSLATHPTGNALTLANGVKSKPPKTQNSPCGIDMKELPSNGKTLHLEPETSADSFLLAKQQTKYGSAAIFSSKIGIVVRNPQLEVEAMIPPLISCCTDSLTPRPTDCTESENFQSFSKQAPQSPSCSRPFAKPALGMSGTKARSLSFSANCSPRDRVLPPSSPGDLSPRTRTHIITNTAERGSPLARQLSSPMPDSPRTVLETKVDVPLEGEAAQSSPSLFCAGNSEQKSFDINEGVQFSKKSPKALSPNERKWGASNAIEDYGVSTRPEKAVSVCPEQDMCKLLLQTKPNSMTQIISTITRTEDGGSTDQPPMGHHSKDRCDSKSNSEPSPESISKAPSSPGASIEEKVMLGIQANVIRKSQEQQSCSRTGSTTADGKLRSGAASSFANWFGFRRNKTASVTTGIPTEIAKKGSNRDILGEGKKGGETARKEEKREWTALGRRLRAKGKRADGKQEALWQRGEPQFIPILLLLCTIFGGFFISMPSKCLLSISGPPEFQCQMRTLDSGIGTFPPPDPASKGVGRTIVQSHSKALVATTAMSNITARAQTLERKLSSVPDTEGICHSLSDPTVARERARTLNGSGRNTTKGTVERVGWGGRTPTAEMRDKIEGDLDRQWVWG